MPGQLMPGQLNRDLLKQLTSCMAIRESATVNYICLIMYLLLTGLPSFAPAISFLQGAGQGHIVNQVKVVANNVIVIVVAYNCLLLLTMTTK